MPETEHRQRQSDKTSTTRLIEGVKTRFYEHALGTIMNLLIVGLVSLFVVVPKVVSAYKDAPTARAAVAAEAAMARQQLADSVSVTLRNLEKENQARDARLLELISNVSTQVEQIGHTIYGNAHKGLVERVGSLETTRDEQREHRRNP